MMDWILIGCFLGETLSLVIPAILVVLILLLLSGIVIYWSSGEKVEDETMEKICSHPIRIVLLILFCWFLGALSAMPEVLVKTNIAKIKLRYTDMETVKKLEGGTLKVVDKLEQLIDKGIERVGEGSDSGKE